MRSANRSNGTWTRKKGVRGRATRPPGSDASRAVWTKSRSEQEIIRDYVAVIAEVAATLEPGTEDCTERQEKFEELIDRFEETEDPIRQKMATVMISFLAGLFVGEGSIEEIKDDLDLERWFRLPKSHERRIHGHRHAGVRIVQEGPTLVHALDAHIAHPGPFTVDDLLPYRTAREPPCQTRGAGPPEDHEEGTIHEETAVTPGRLGAALSRIAYVLARCRAVVFYCPCDGSKTLAFRRNL